MKDAKEFVRSLEQQETGEIRRLRCSQCGRRSFQSPAELHSHEMICLPASATERRTGK